MKAKLLKNRDGTALIVALLVMGVLMAISLALSALVLRESVVTREFLDAGQSFYAAESASEIGLYGVKNNLPGWEPTDGVSVPISVGENAVAELKVSNKCRAYPCFDEGYDKSTAAPEAFYATLGLNESATIPLFVMGDDGKPQKVTDFVVEFYAGFGPNDLNVKRKLPNGDQVAVSDWDVLRWKIVGLNDTTKTTKSMVTESISDFTSVSTLTGGLKTMAEKPSWFGTMDNWDSKGLVSGRYTDKIAYTPYTPSPGGCGVTEAREFYLYKSGETGKSEIDQVRHCYKLADFMSNHILNYLTLTNLINPSVLNASKDDRKTKLYYRVELFTDNGASGRIATDTVRDFADITADGYSGRSKQSVNVKIKRDSFMPVFNFSLYSTYMDKKGENTDGGEVHDEEYWYGKKTTDD